MTARSIISWLIASLIGPFIGTVPVAYILSSLLEDPSLIKAAYLALLYFFYPYVVLGLPFMIANCKKEIRLVIKKSAFFSVILAILFATGFYFYIFLLAAFSKASLFEILVTALCAFLFPFLSTSISGIIYILVDRKLNSDASFKQT